MGAGGSAYPERICPTCGERHGKQKTGAAVPFVPGKCDVCGDPETMVTDPTWFGELHPLWRVRQRELSVPARRGSVGG